MAPEFGEVLFEPLTVDDVVDATIDGIRERRFLIAPAPNVLDMFRAKADDYEGFLSEMQERVAALRHR